MLLCPVVYQVHNSTVGLDSNFLFIFFPFPSNTLFSYKLIQCMHLSHHDVYFAPTTACSPGHAYTMKSWAELQLSKIQNVLMSSMVLPFLVKFEVFCSPSELLGHWWCQPFFNVIFGTASRKRVVSPLGFRWRLRTFSQSLHAYFMNYMEIKLWQSQTTTS